MFTQILYNRFKKQMDINPFTGRKIKIRGPTYFKLVIEAEKFRTANTKADSIITNNNKPRKKIEYFTHYNGGDAFHVAIDGNKVYLSHVIYDEHNDKDQKGDLAKTYIAEKIFIGNSYINGWTLFSGGYGPGFDGNSFLLKLKGLEYLHIGTEVFSFQAESEITDYYSMVGNNDVPYPFAVDKKKNCYLMIEGNILLPFEKSGYNIDKDKEKNPYDFYYNNSKNKKIYKAFKSNTEYNAP